MKNVLQIFSLLSLFMLVMLVEIHATEKRKIDVNRELDMMGELLWPQERSIQGNKKDIRVFQNSEKLQAIIKGNFGVLKINIKHEGNIIYTTTLNTTIQKSWTFDSEKLKKGYYIIEFNDSNNRHLTAHFTL